MSDGVYFVDRERRILYWSEGAYRLTGYKAEELLGKFCQDDILCHVDYAGKRLCQEDCPLAASISDGGLHEANVFLRHKQGRRVPVTVRVQPLEGADGSIIGAIEIFSDDSAQTEERRRTEAMNRLAFLDHLTQLPNRRFMEMSLHTALTEFQVHHDPLQGNQRQFRPLLWRLRFAGSGADVDRIASSHGHGRPVGRRRVFGHRPQHGSRDSKPVGGAMRSYGCANHRAQ